MDPTALLIAAAFVLATAAALWLDAASERRGLSPPGLSIPWRRAGAVVLVAGVLLLAVFLPVMVHASAPEPEAGALRPADLFLGHQLLLLAVLGWAALGWVGVPGASFAAVAEPLGLRAERPGRELAIGLVAGVGAWLGVLAVVYAVAIAIQLAGAERWLQGLQRQPPEVVWMAGLPLGWKLALSLSAGFSEEVFFRGFLQKRLGVWAATVCFVLAHVAYGQPFLLLGVTVLSLLYGLLVRQRGNVWAAMVAHTLFDVVQLAVVIPTALEAAEP